MSVSFRAWGVMWRWNLVVAVQCKLPGPAASHRNPRAFHVRLAIEAPALTAASTPRMLAIFFGLISAVLAPRRITTVSSFSHHYSKIIIYLYIYIYFNNIHLLNLQEMGGFGFFFFFFSFLDHCREGEIKRAGN